MTRNRILQAAIDLFGENGREGAAIREVARRASVSMSTVLHHFGNKQGLFDACVKAMFERLGEHREAMLELAQSTSGARETADQVVRHCFRFARSHSRLLRVISCETVTSGRLPEGVRDRVVLPILDDATEMVTEMIDRPPAEARMVVMSICHIITRFVLTNPEELRRLLAVESNGDDEAIYDLVENHVARDAALLMWGSLS